MERILSVFLCALLVCTFTACDKEQNEETKYDAASPSQSDNTPSTIIPDTYTFIGEVLSVEKGMILVSPDKQNSAISPEVFVNVSQFSELKFEKGDRVKVVFNGQVAQSFPPQILGVINIEIIE
ncbi:MAG: hypothetical protein E7526_02855 [Ruminococcaceae bacterium]|nr:hypothetical protein [Oscillospiraceae bacterium]